MITNSKSFQLTIILLAILAFRLVGSPADTVVEGVVVIKNWQTTLMSCGDGTTCCNKASGEMIFISRNDSLTLYKYDYAYPERFNCRLGQDSIVYCDSLYFLSPAGAYSCTSSACEELHCGPFYNNRRYRLTGYYIKEHHVRDETNVIYFKVNKYELISIVK